MRAKEYPMKLIRLALCLAILAVASRASAETVYCCSESSCCFGVGSVEECNAEGGVPFFKLTTCLQNCSLCPV
jgi:hypothetical protein